MFDTNILVDFLLIEWKNSEKQPIHNELKRSNVIYKALLDKKVINHITSWNLLEYRDVVMKLVTEKKLIQNGYSLPEFSEGKKILPLTSKEIEDINKAVADIKKISLYFQGDIDERGLRLIESICKKGFTLLDAIHLLEAMVLEDCKYFVTRDNFLYNLFNNKLKKIYGNEIEVVNRKEFIVILNKKYFNNLKLKNKLKINPL